MTESAPRHGAEGADRHVEQSWSEAGRQAAWQRRRRALGLVAVLLVCVGLWLYAERPPASETEPVATEAADGERTLDTSPFERALPDNTGSTTIPGGVFGDDGSATSSSTSTTTAPIPTTTQTTLPPPVAPELQPASGIDDLCGMSRSLLSLGTLRTASAADVMATSTRVESALNRYIQVAPDDLRAEVERIHDVITGLTQRARAANGDLSGPLGDEIDKVTQGDGSYAGLIADIEKVANWERVVCG